MIVNKYKFNISANNQYINIPLIVANTDLGREDLIDKYEEDILNDIINPIEDFDVTRFSHKPWIVSNQSHFGTNTTVNAPINTDINYEFYFFKRDVDITATTVSSTNWVSDYNFVVDTQGNYADFSGMSFTNKEIYYYVNSFKRSFFKLDLYDNPNPETQKLYITIIIPTQQGTTQSADIGGSVSNNVDVRTPTFQLDYVGDKEGYFIYWLKNSNYIDINEFYMSAKFFNAKSGEFVRMLNVPQSDIPQRFNFKPTTYFYYKVLIDYSTYEYEVYRIDDSQTRVGTSILNKQIKWYEYINP